MSGRHPLLVGQFSDSFIPVPDGVAYTVKNYANELAMEGCYVYVIAPKFPNYYDQERFSVLRYFSLPIPMRKPYRAGIPELDPFIYNKLKKIPFSIVHIHSPFSAGRLGLYAGRRSNSPVVATFHSKYRDDLMRAIHNRRLVDNIIKKIVRLYDSVDEVWVPQPGITEVLREYGYKGKTVVIENGTEFGNRANLEYFRQNAAPRLINGNKKILLYVGQLIHEKNISFLIESIRYLKHPDFVLWIVGEGYAGEEMKQMVLKHHLEDKILFKGVIRNRRELEEIYASADLFLFPSLYDNAPLVVREAASAGTPSLLIRGSHAAEIIEENVNGFLSNPEPLVYARMVDYLLNNPALTRRAGINASRALARSWKNIAEEVKDRYESLIRRKERKMHYINDKETSFNNFSSRRRAIRLTTVRLISSSTGRLGS